MRILVIIGLLLLTIILNAQYKVQFILRSSHDLKQSDHIYISGNFNNWNPGNENYKLKKLQKNYGITIDVPKGEIQYKFTLGNWDKVELGSNNETIKNRILKVEGDTTINVEIENWSDHVHAERQSTANKNVHILKSDFFIPQLNRNRRIWIYLPESYATSSKRYPVLYLQDGQNVFDDVTAFSGEWGVDESLDTLGKQTKECIVIAIDNGGEKRVNEYNPYDMEKYGKGEGNLYVEFLVQTLKPYVDSHFRTKKDIENTFIAGSSLGGLISFYAILKYPKTFGGAGVFSPAFWIAPQLIKDVKKWGKKVKGSIYFYAGEAESETMVPDMKHIYEMLHGLSSARMVMVLKKEGKHSETDWRREFPYFYKFIIN